MAIHISGHEAIEVAVGADVVGALFVASRADFVVLPLLRRVVPVRGVARISFEVHEVLHYRAIASGGCIGAAGRLNARHEKAEWIQVFSREELEAWNLKM